MMRCTTLLALLAATIALCSAAPSSTQPIEITNFAESLNKLTDQESSMLDAWVGNLILQQKRNGEGGLPTRFLNEDLEGLETTVKHLPLKWIETGQEPASDDEIQSMIIGPCKSVLSKIDEAAEAYRKLGDGAFLYGLVYDDICKSVVEHAVELGGQIGKGTADDAQEEAEASFIEPIENSFENLQLDSEPSNEEAVDHDDEIVEAAVHEPAVEAGPLETSSVTSPAVASEVAPEVAPAPKAVESH